MAAPTFNYCSVMGNEEDEYEIYLLGSSYISWRRLWPLTSLHLSTGSVSTSTLSECLEKWSRKVVFPQPMLPSTTTVKGLLQSFILTGLSLERDFTRLTNRPMLAPYMSGMRGEGLSVSSTSLDLLLTVALTEWAARQYVKLVVLGLVIGILPPKCVNCQNLRQYLKKIKYIRFNPVRTILAIEINFHSH